MNNRIKHCYKVSPFEIHRTCIRRTCLRVLGPNYHDRSTGEPLNLANAVVQLNNDDDSVTLTHIQSFSDVVEAQTLRRLFES